MRRFSQACIWFMPRFVLPVGIDEDVHIGHQHASAQSLLVFVLELRREVRRFVTNATPCPPVGHERERWRGR